MLQIHDTHPRSRLHHTMVSELKNFGEGQRKPSCKCRSRDGNGIGYGVHWGKEIEQSKQTPWIGTRGGKGGEGDLSKRGEDRSTVRH